METHAFGVRLPANAPEGQKRFPISRWDPGLRFPHSMFEGFQDAELRDIAPKLARTRFTDPLPGVFGWLSPREKQLLYAFGRWLRGPFFEVGPWVGKSTCCIASGIRDSGQRRQFLSAELNPSLANFRPVENGIGFFYPPDSTTIMGTCTLQEFEDEVRPVVTGPGRVIGELNRNLARLQLDQFVEIREGSFANVEDKGFRFLFVDSMHTPEEIARNASHLQRHLRPGVILACHDLNCHPDNESALRETFNYGHTLTVDTTLVGEIV
jgi:hypothetical protein